MLTSLVGRRSQFNRVNPGVPGAFKFATGCPVDFVTEILISSPVNSFTQTVNSPPSGGFCPRQTPLPCESTNPGCKYAPVTDRTLNRCAGSAAVSCVNQRNGAQASSR